MNQERPKPVSLSNARLIRRRLTVFRTEKRHDGFHNLGRCGAFDLFVWVFRSQVLSEAQMKFARFVVSVVVMYALLSSGSQPRSPVAFASSPHWGHQFTIYRLDERPEGYRTSITCV